MQKTQTLKNNDWVAGTGVDNMAIKKGDKIKVEYEGKLESGEVFDSSAKQGKPLEFEVGTGQIIKGFDEAVIGMEKGQEKEITLEPKDAYGDPNPQMIKTVPRDKIGVEAELKPGQYLGVQLPSGAQFPAKILEVNDKEVKLDMNHPLAGKKLNFKIKIVDVA